MILDLLLRHMRPSPGFAVATLSTSCALLLAAAAALRLHWQADVDRRARREVRLVAEESQRAGRLTALASLVAAAVGELEDELEEVSRRARAASVVMPDKGEQMLQQARHARDIVRELTHAFRLSAPGPRRDIDVVTLLEEVVEGRSTTACPPRQPRGAGRAACGPRRSASPRRRPLAPAAQCRPGQPGGVLRIRGHSAKARSSSASSTTGRASPSRCGGRSSTRSSPPAASATGWASASLSSTSSRAGAAARSSSRTRVPAPASPCAFRRPRRRPTPEPADRGPLPRPPSCAAPWPSSWPSSRVPRAARPSASSSRSRRRSRRPSPWAGPPGGRRDHAGCSGRGWRPGPVCGPSRGPCA